MAPMRKCSMNFLRFIFQIVTRPNAFCRHTFYIFVFIIHVLYGNGNIYNYDIILSSGFEGLNLLTYYLRYYVRMLLCNTHDGLIFFFAH